MGKHIAILCMSLNIGGAETHIFELAKSLKSKGHTVTVFSNGGVYTKELEKAGVHHIQAPLHTKTLRALFCSYRILRKAFQENRPSVVHSHTRISNFVGGLVCKRLKIPMVTTVHFNFRSDFFFRFFSNWGCRALAVSEDLKEYLIQNYQYDPAHVALTVNGIDLERFKKRELPEFRKTLGVAPNQKLILMVTRLDKESSVHVSIFFRLAPAIFKNAPETRVVIVGDGKLFPFFAKEAAEINRRCGTDFIRLQGAKTNIWQYTAAADLFIGISRSALEAMASSLPVILLGNLGYLGLYSDQIRRQCIETNLTCRGYPYPSDAEMIALITDCLESKNLSASIEAGLRLVRECYSIETMAEDALAVYREATDAFRPLDYMISGYYGSDNFGDNLTLNCLMDHLKGQSGTVLTCNVQNTVVPPGVHKIHRFHLWQIRKAMKRTKVFLLGSGSILQDATSSRSLFYYHFIMGMAVRYHCKTLLYANGIGPINRRINQRRTTAILNKMDLITVRDQDSMDLLQKLQIHCSTLLTADDSFSYNFSSLSPCPPVQGAAGKTIVGINFKLESGLINAPLSEIAQALTILAEKYSFFYYLIPFHHSQDYPLLSALHRQLPDISHLIEPTDNPQVLIRYVAAGSYQIFERLHGQIMATILNTPFLPISYDPKIRSLAAQLGLSEYLLNHTQLSCNEIVWAFEKILQDQAHIKRKLASYTEEARLRAQKNQQILLQMIEDY